MRLIPTCFFSLFVINCFCQDLDDGLLLHYPMSGDANDISGNDFHGIVNASLAADRFGNENEAFYFNGVDAFIDFPNVDELKPPLPLTIAFWIKYDGFVNTDRAVFNTSLEEDVSSGFIFTSQESTGKYAIGYGDGSNFYSASSRRSYVSESVIDTESWHHVTLVCSGPFDMQIYIDCEEAGGTYSGSGGELFYSDSPGSLGRHDQTVGVDSYYFEGFMDDFRYWNRALTLEEIGLVCNANVGAFDCPELSLNIGDSCDDGDMMTMDDIVLSDCSCIGTPIEPVDCDDWVMFLNDNDANQTDIYGVDISSGEAVLSYLTTLDFMAHMAYNSDNNMLYVVNNTIGYYVIVNPHVSPITVSAPVILSQEIPSITVAAFSPNGRLLVGSSTDNKIYSINIESNLVSIFDEEAQVEGGDITFNNEGMLYLATRSGNGLYELYPDDVMNDQFIGSIEPFVTGMVLTETDQLLTSHNGLESLNLINLDGSITDINYPLLLDGVPFQHHNGDMAAGCYSTSDIQPEVMMFLENNVISIYPNPSNGNSEIVFVAVSSANTVIEIFDLNGKKVKTLFDQTVKQGEAYKLTMDGTSLTNGIYLCKMTTDKGMFNEKIIISK